MLIEKHSVLTAESPLIGKTVELRRLFALVVLLFLTGIGDCFAHAAERGFVLLLPTGYYLLGGTLAVATSILLASVLRYQVLRVFFSMQFKIPLKSTSARFFCSAAGFIVLLLLLLTGFYGSHDPLSNPLPLTIWTLFWVGLTLAHAVAGNFWSLFNPWYAPVSLINRYIIDNGSVGSTGCQERETSRQGSTLPAHFRLSEKLGYLPAIAGFLLFAWFELVSLAPEDPLILTKVVGSYWLFHCLAILAFGETWLQRGEPFSVFFRFISLLSPFTRTNKGITIGLPGYRLLSEPPIGWSGAAFVLITLATVSFDGLNKTFWWLHLNDINPLDFRGRSSVTLINGTGLLIAVTTLPGLYFLTTWLGWKLAKKQKKKQDTHKPSIQDTHKSSIQDTHESSIRDTRNSENSAGGTHMPSYRSFAGLLALAIMPISLGYHLSHYTTQLLVNAQYALAAFSDPFAADWNLFNLQGFRVTTSFLSHHASVERIWLFQVVVIVAAHIFSVALAHLLALRLFNTNNSDGQNLLNQKLAVVSLLPMGILMVLYTLFGLWLLSTPTGA